jgi:hypothetical protein
MSFVPSLCNIILPGTGRSGSKIFAHELLNVRGIDCRKPSEYGGSGTCNMEYDIR